MNYLKINACVEYVDEDCLDANQKVEMEQTIDLDSRLDTKDIDEVSRFLVRLLRAVGFPHMEEEYLPLESVNWKEYALRQEELKETYGFDFGNEMFTEIENEEDDKEEN